MNKSYVKRIARLLLLCLLLLGCAGTESAPLPTPRTETVILLPEATSAPTAVATDAPPVQRLKYVFLFIGDGMGDVQVSVADATAALLDREPLLFPTFPVHTTVATHNVKEKTTDSAAASTALSGGQKTENGRIGQTPDGVSTTPVAETFRRRGYRVGIMTTVTCDHATPAGFYAHRESRTDYEGITADLFASGYEFFAGCGLSSKITEPQNGYTLFSGSPEDAPDISPLLLLAENAVSDAGTRYAMDGGARTDLLARFVTAAVARLDSDAGFFLMAEGGNIDTACHNHDGAAMVYEVLDFDAAIRTAYAFYEQHPDETLIVVTADHETGTLGQSGGDLSALAAQTRSLKAFDETDVRSWKKTAAAFSDALPVIEASFGLSDLSAEDTAYLEAALSHTLKGDLSSDERIELYASNAYSPIAMAVGNLVAARAGLTFGSRGHSNAPVSVYAVGVGADAFSTVADNTDIPKTLLSLLDRYPL